ncbi:MAG: cytochrome c oxidase subunit 3 family protein [Planctomycetes bacterium]|nr:cytochrome c oxidase subunit 3 family protein [Planctomycetota bacterium]
MSGHATIVTPTPEGFRPHAVAHHFKTAEQEFQAGKLGFWLFLATEIMLFGGLFAAYFLYHGVYAETFRVGGSTLNWHLGAFNTVLLLTSSWTMAMAVRASQLSNRKALIGFLSLTWLCAAGFMVVKYFEYTYKFSHGIGPGYFFAPEGHYAELFAGLPFPNLYFALYFTMTGIHGLHVLVGMGLIAWLIVRSSKGHFHSGFYTPVELVGLYWHVVDLIWIFLFPLLYLVP